MIVPLVAELSAWTSVYGRLAPLPPVAVAAKAGVAASTATPARPAVASVMDVAPARSRRLRPRSFGGLDLGAGRNIVDPLDMGGMSRGLAAAYVASPTVTLNSLTTLCKMLIFLSKRSTN